MQNARGAAIAILLACQVACSTDDRRQHVEIAANVELPSGTWVEFRFLDLQTPGDVNMVCVEAARPFTVNLDGFSIASPDGFQVVPSLRLVADRSEQALEHRSMLDAELCFEAVVDEVVVGAALKDRYDALRILSPKRISLKRVRWISGHK